jgi:hypothetical protein
MLLNIALNGLSALAGMASAPPLQTGAADTEDSDKGGARPCEVYHQQQPAFDRRALLPRAPRLIIASRGRPRS